MNWVLLMTVSMMTCFVLAAEVHPEHPRILVRQKDLPALQERVAGDYAASFKQITDYLDKRVLPLEYTGHSWGWAYNLRTLAFAYLLNKNPAYLEKINEILIHVHEDIPTEEFSCALYTRTTAMAYDWCYNDMTVAQRTLTAETLLKLARHQQSLWKHNDYNNHYVFNWMSPMWAAIALTGDGHAGEEMSELLQLLEKHLKERVIVAANDVAGDDGGQPEGYFYANWGYFPPLAWLLELWRVGTGEDLFNACTSLHFAALWNIYGMRPFNGTLERNDDCMEGYRFKEGNEGTFMQLCAQRYGDPYAAWIGSQLKPSHPTRLFYNILWQDKSIEKRDPQTLPLAKHFDGLGWVSTRSSWKSDAVFGLFECGDLYAGHQHFDNNAFVIHRYDLLATDTGYYESGKHRGNYFARSIAHNTVTIYDPNEQFGGNTWGGGKPGSGANDGGQTYIFHPESVVEKTENKKFERGNIIAYESSPCFTYAVGDATASYAAHKLKEFTRTFIHIQPDMFVVFDRVDAHSAEYKKTWLLHADVEPRVTGDTMLIENGDGRLYAQCLMPKQHSIQVRGGLNNAYIVDGVDYPPKAKYKKAAPWRIELSPQEKTQRQYFLHFIHVPERGAEPIRAQVVEEDSVFVCAWEHNQMQYTLRLVAQSDGLVKDRLHIKNGNEVILDHSFGAGVQQERSVDLLVIP